MYSYMYMCYKCTCATNVHVLLYVCTTSIILYVLVIAPLGGVLLVYRPETRGHVALEGEELL